MHPAADESGAPFHTVSCRMNLLRAVAFGSSLAAATAFAGNPAEPAGAPVLVAPPRVPVPQRPRSPLRSADADAATYDHCMNLAKEAPPAARDLAERWHDRGGAHPADHCFAIALIGLKQYKSAGDRLEKLAQAMIHAPAPLRAE